jgi:hypothetical protein
MSNSSKGMQLQWAGVCPLERPLPALILTAEEREELAGFCRFP